MQVEKWLEALAKYLNWNAKVSARFDNCIKYQPIPRLTSKFVSSRSQVASISVHNKRNKHFATNDIENEFWVKVVNFKNFAIISAEMKWKFHNLFFMFLPTPKRLVFDNATIATPNTGTARARVWDARSWQKHPCCSASLWHRTIDRKRDPASLCSHQLI